MKISLVILTLNERVGVESVVPAIPQECVEEIFVIDGGSSDGTIEYFEKSGIAVHIQKKRGRGEAFRLAFEMAKGDALIFFSPDGNEDPKDIPKFRPYLEKGFDIVIGNRMSRGGANEEDSQFLKLRKWANNAFTLMANLTWNRDQPYVFDTINGYRAITRQAWEKLRPDGEGYVIEYQTSILAFKQGVRIAEFPTIESPRLDDRVGSPSLSTGLAFLKLYFKELLPKKLTANFPEISN